MGGSWAILVAARHPELVSKAMVVDMLPAIGVMFRRPGMTEEQFTGFVDQLQAMMANSTPEMRRGFIQQSISQMTNTESERQGIIDASLASDQAVAAQGFADLARTDLLQDVGRIRVPLVVLYTDPGGAAQMGLTPERIDTFYTLSYRAAPHAVVTRVPGTAHFIMFDNPGFFQARLREFLTTPGTLRPATTPTQ